MKRISIFLFSILAIGLALPIVESPEFPDPYVAGHLIVQFKPEYRGLINVEYRDGIFLTGIAAVDELNKNYQLEKIHQAYPNPNPNENAKRFGIDLIYLFTFPEATRMVDLVNAYRYCPAIEHADPNSVYQLDYVPNDSLYYNQWHHQNLQCERAWDITHGDTNAWLGIIDDGVDWEHLDLEDNLWINYEEDINHNGRYDPYAPPAGDLNNVDDDANGYTDDVIGFDFLYWDGDPMPTDPYNDTHGTLCFGAACAVTDNTRGVAGIGFGARASGLKCGEGNSIFTYYAIIAIGYAADNGAFAISMSWGGSGVNPELDNMIQYAWSLGCVLMASAGNNYSGGQRRYPAGYDHVIATAASDQIDRRSIWLGGEESNYGDWVDLAAPGTDVWTTDTRNHYSGDFAGTSAASPCVGGLAVLLKSAYPAMTNAECTTRIFQSCDSMPDSTYRLGLLGWGRINAGKAVHQPIRCFLQMTDYRIVDRSGNNNGYPDLGETCAVVITLANDPYWQTATNVSATFHTLDTSITFLNSTATFPDISAGTARSCSADSMVFFVHSNAVPHRIRFTVTKNSTPASYDLDEQIIIPVGAPRVILVDDDDFDSGTNDVADWYKHACDSLGVLYRLWTVTSSGSPPLETLNNYPVTVWFTGIDSTQTLTSTDLSTLSSYLDSGHSLFLCGQNLGQDIGTQPFYADYLHTRYISNRITTGLIPKAVGINDDPIGYSDTDTLALMGSGGAGNARSMDGITPLSGGVGSHHYVTNPDTIYAGTHYSGTYKVVYFGFPFEAIAGNPARYTQKWQILARILTFFGEGLPGTKEEIEMTYNPILLPFSIAPNPFRNQTTIRWQLANIKNCQLRIYDIKGKLVKSHNLSNIPAQSFTWNGKDNMNRTLPAGVYFCEVKNENVTLSGKVMFLK